MGKRLNYANVMSTFAVFAALGGGAYAAAKIDSGDIARNAVLSKHIGKDQVRGGDVKESSLKGLAPLGYGHVVNGHLVASDSKGVKLGNSNASGLFCVRVKGNPKNVQATVEDNAGGLEDITATLNLATVFQDCPSGTDAGVLTGDNQDTFLDQDFFILFY